MTPDDFRALALSFPDTVESAHHAHPDFRVRGRIFATLGYPNDDWGVVCVSPAEQARLTTAEPDVFVPVKGAWGRDGSTQVNLRVAKTPSVRKALAAALKHRAPVAGQR
jgi:hypothetical protein